MLVTSRRFTLALALLSAAIATRARAEDPTQALGFAFDAGFASSRDDLIVPRALTGPRLALGPRYAAQLGPGALAAELHVAIAYELDRDGNQGLAFDHALDVRYTFALGRAAGLQHAFGPALGWDTDIAYPEAWDDAHAYWIATRFIGVAWRGFVVAPPGYRWDFMAELPLFALVSRPESYRRNKQDALTHLSYFFVDVQADPELAWLAQLQQLRLSADLWRSCASGFVVSGWAIGAEARIAHASEPRSAFALRTTLRFTAAWGL